MNHDRRTPDRRAQVLDDLASFQMTSMQELETLKDKGLLSTEHYKSAKATTLRFLQPLQTILMDQGFYTLADDTFSQFVNHYKLSVTQHLTELRSRAYSKAQLRQRMSVFVQVHIAEISARIRDEGDTQPFLKTVMAKLDHVKAIKTHIDQLQRQLVEGFEAKIQELGEPHRSRLFQAVMEQFEEELCQIIDSYFIDHAIEHHPTIVEANKPRELTLGDPLLPSIGASSPEPSPSPSTIDYQAPPYSPPIPPTSEQRLQQIQQDAKILSERLQGLVRESDLITTHLKALLNESLNLSKLPH